MIPNLALVLTIAGLYSAGVYLLLERSLTRVLLGFLLLGNATNILLLASGGPAGSPPLVGVTDEADMSDPLPQAMALTAIVITMGLAAFVLSLIYRGYRLDRQDDVQDDLEDRNIAERARRDPEAGDDA